MKKLNALVSVIFGVIAAYVLSLFMSSDIALFFGFIIVIALLIYGDRRKVKLEGVILIRRTKKGRDFIDRIATGASGFWRVAGVVGIVLAVILMIGGSVLLINQAYLVISGAQGGVKLLLPGPVSTPVNAPGVFVVPWWIWIIGIAFVIIPHEFMHGIMCRIDKVRIKSVGWLLLFVIPGAFVEPDEKQLKKMSKTTKLRVYAAGSFANMIMAAIVLIIFAIFFAAAVKPAGVLVATVQGGPAYNASLNGSIISLDHQNIFDNSGISRILSQHKPGDTIEVRTATTLGIVPSFVPEINKPEFNGTADWRFGTIKSPANIIPGAAAAIDTSNIKSYNITLGSRPDKPGAFLGISPVTIAVTLAMPLATYATVATLLLWMFVFSFGIGLVNLLPIKPLDGGLVLEELVGGRKKVVRVISVIMLLVLLFNLIGPLFLTR